MYFLAFLQCIHTHDILKIVNQIWSEKRKTKGFVPPRHQQNRAESIVHSTNERIHILPVKYIGFLIDEMNSIIQIGDIISQHMGKRNLSGEETTNQYPNSSKLDTGNDVTNLPTLEIQGSIYTRSSTVTIRSNKIPKHHHSSTTRPTKRLHSNHKHKSFSTTKSMSTTGENKRIHNHRNKTPSHNNKKSKGLSTTERMSTTVENIRIQNRGNRSQSHNNKKSKGNFLSSPPDAHSSTPSHHGRRLHKKTTKCTQCQTNPSVVSATPERHSAKNNNTIKNHHAHLHEKYGNEIEVEESAVSSTSRTIAHHTIKASLIHNSIHHRPGAHAHLPNPVIPKPDILAAVLVDIILRGTLYMC